MQSAKPDVVAGTLSRPPSLTAVLAFVCACLMGTAIGQWVTAPEDVTITF